MLIPSTCAERAFLYEGERAFPMTRSLLGFAFGKAAKRNEKCSKHPSTPSVDGVLTHGAKSSPIRCSSCGTRKYTNGGDSLQLEPEIYAAVFRF